MKKKTKREIEIIKEKAQIGDPASVNMISR